MLVVMAMLAVAATIYAITIRIKKVIQERRILQEDVDALAGVPRGFHGESISSTTGKLIQWYDRGFYGRVHSKKGEILEGWCTIERVGGRMPFRNCYGYVDSRLGYYHKPERLIIEVGNGMWISPWLYGRDVEKIEVLGH